MTPPTTQTGMEERFDKEIGIIEGYKLCITYEDQNDQDVENQVKSFIRSEITKAVGAERQRILIDMALIGAKIPKYDTQGWTKWIDEYVKKGGLDPIKIRLDALKGEK